MKQSALQPSSFAAYTPAARALAVEHLALLRTMPMSLLPAFLVQIESGDRLFPVEQQRLRAQLSALAANPSLMRAFAAISVPDTVTATDWVKRPGVCEDILSRSLWETHQIDAYHRAAEQLFAALPVPPAPAHRAAPLLVAVFGQGASPDAYPLFRRLRASGLYARRVNEQGARDQLCGLLRRRAAAHPAPYAHWYVDGGEPWMPAGVAGGVCSFNYPELAPLDNAVLRTMNTAVREGWGPELLSDRMRELTPAALDATAATTDPRLAHLFVTLLTQGSGTQLYSTSFVQAAAVELMRRAQPSTVLLRFAPRRRPASMNDMLEQHGQSTQTDPEGSLVDADMAVYYAWLALRQQPDGNAASLVALVEDQGQAFVAGPAVTRGVETASPLTMEGLLATL